jgi:hypothetical protein
LQRKKAGVETPTLCHIEKLPALLQTLHGMPRISRQPGATIQAESRLRPLARRAAMTLRPPTVAMRAR